MTREQIVKLFADMLLEHKPNKRRKAREEWKIPCENWSIRIILKPEDPNTSFPYQSHDEIGWNIGISVYTGGQYGYYTQEEAIKLIQNQIINQFENIGRYNNGSSKWTYSYYSSGGCELPIEPKPIFKKPEYRLPKPQISYNKPRSLRLGYTGKR